MKTNKNANRGFTLIEMLVVIAIIGLLASILVPAVTKALESANRTKMVNNASQLYKALYTIVADGGGIYDGRTFDFPSHNDTTGAFVPADTTRDYFAYLATNGVLQVPWSFFAAKDVPAAPGIYDGTPGSLAAFTSNNNAWRAVSNLSTQDVGAPFLVSRNLTAPALNGGYDVNARVTELAGAPYRENGLVVLFVGGNAQPMLNQALLWRNLNPTRKDNVILGP